MIRFHKINVTDRISQNFLTISAKYEPLSNEQIRLKYPPEIAEKFIQQANEIDILTQTYDSDKFSINVRQNLYITKKKKEADFVVTVENQNKNKVAIVKELKDPSNTHKYSHNNVIIAVKDKLFKNNIKLDYKSGFNSYVLNLFIDFYNVKSDVKYAYLHKIGKQSHYTYSEELVNFIFDEIKKDPQNFVESLKRFKK